MKNRMLILLSTILFVGTANANLIINGSLTGPLANSGVPSGWSITSPSPDTNDATNAANAGNIYDVPASLSPDGGTWVGVARNASFIESFGQLVTGFTVGEQYELTWFNAHFGTANYIGDNSFSALIDGVSIGEGSSLSLDTNWLQESIIFTASATSHQLDFQLAYDAKAYLQIDGIVLEGLTTVPEPSTLIIFALGMIAVAARRFKRQS